MFLLIVFDGSKLVFWENSVNSDEFVNSLKLVSLVPSWRFEEEIF